MKRAIWIVMIVFLALTGSSALTMDLSSTDIVPDTSMTPVAAPPDCGGSWRVVRLHCRKRSQGAVVGQYGGTDFFLACNADRQTTTICTTGTDYRYLMEGQAPGAPIARCADEGSAVQVNAFCGGLHLTIN